MLNGYKKLKALEKANQARLDRIKEEHEKEIADIKETYHIQEGQVVDVWKSMYQKDVRLLKEKIEDLENQVTAFKSEKDRMEKLLTKVNKRAGTYRAMMEAVAAWEEEIAIEREDDKLEKFLKWKNENDY